MSRPSHILVTAAPGRLVPIHPTDGREPGGSLMYVEPGAVRRVRYSQDIERAILDSDLIPCRPDGTPVKSLDLAHAPVEIEHGPAFVPQGADTRPAAAQPPSIAEGVASIVQHTNGGRS